MARRIIDLSIYLENDVISDPPPFGPKITYMDHDSTFPQMAPFFPGLFPLSARRKKELAPVRGGKRVSMTSRALIV